MNLRKQDTVKIVITGPESSGKTALAQALAHALNALWVPEFARYYLANLGRPYERTDLKYIGRGQYAWEQWFAAPAPRWLICDTDWTVLHIWEHYRFGLPATRHWEWQKGYPHRQLADWYFLCAPDFPWQPDPLREHPAEREVLFEWYERLLRESGAAYAVSSGGPENRLQEALSLLQRHFQLPNQP